jgi:hypothetical protein
VTFTGVGACLIDADQAGNANYLAAPTSTQNIAIAKGTPILIWADPAPIGYGSALGPAQLNAVASLPGSFSYSPPIGSSLHAGTNEPLTVTFTPADIANYTTATKMVHLNVNQAALTVAADNKSRLLGQPNPAFTATFTGLVNGDTPGAITGTVTYITTAKAASPPGAYPVAPSGLASGDYHIMYTPGTLTIAQATTATSVTAASQTAGVNQPATFDATVTAVPSTVVAAPTGTVSFFVDNTPTAAAVVPLANGHALYITDFGAGTHSVVAIYRGDTNFAPSTSSAAATTVRCTTTITGAHGAVTATSGITCIVNAHISGSVTVQRGAIVDIENTAMAGAFSANGAGGIRICASTSATVTIAGSTGFVLVGDAGDDQCASNAISGSLNLVHNTAGLEAVANTVTGAITASANIGAGPLTEDTTPEIDANHK